MKLAFMVSVFGSLLWATSAPVRSPIEKLLEQNIRLDWPEATRIEVNQVSSKKVIPSQAILLQIHPRPAMGAISFEASWKSPEGPQRTFGTAVVRVYQPVAVARANLNPQEALDEVKIQFEEREISKFTQNGIFSHWEELEGKTAKTFIKAGMPVHRVQTESPAEIRQGQMVDLIFNNNQLLISARMKALEHGRLGNWIRVENPNSKRVIRARVSAPGQVAIR